MTGRQDVNSQQSSNPSPWVSNDYFEPTTKFEESRLGDAKEQLEGFCTIYHRVAFVYHDQQDSKQYQFILSFFFLQHCCPPAKWLLKNQRMYLWSWKNQLNNLIRAMFHKLHTQFIFQISHKQFYWINYFMLNWKYFNFIWWPLNRWPFDVEQLVMYFIRRAWLVCKVKDSGFTTEVIF